ncbi:MAG: ATP-binding protein, partial [Pseudomonadota bacterium]
PVLWDRGRIDQVLANLLTNALRYTDAPGAVRLSLFEAANDVRLTLEDTAPAVPEAQLEQLFEPLFRLEGSRARASGGSGLGLAVSKSIVRAHGGTIRAQASELGGLAISLSLPKDARRAV